MTNPDAIDEAAEREQQMIDVALANREKPEPRSPVCRNADCGQPSLKGSSYCCRECCKDHARQLWAEM